MSSVRLFADDCVLYRNIYSIQDCFILQEDLTSLGQWKADWQMKFNVAKCHSMRVTRHQHHKQILFYYSLHNQTLESVQSAKYLVLSYDVASGSEITPCNKICKPLVVYRFTGNVMTSITTLRT